jgi:K+-sensing histidine kinase KdpD
LFVNVGTTVKKGTLLATLENNAELQGLAQAKVALNVAVVQLNNLTSNIQALQETAATNALSYQNAVTAALNSLNAVKAQVQIKASENEVAIGVRDYGLGFNEEDAPYLFDRFWRADPSRARTSGGTGLGLSIALEDAKLHQGQLLAWGKPQHGAHFVLTLPKLHGNSVQSFPISLIPVDLLSTTNKI